MHIPYGRQDVTSADIEAVDEVLRSDFLTQGPLVPSFERAVAQMCNATHAIAVNSATSALHIACLALGVGFGDLVWTTSNTFVASANCALYCGAAVDFVDIDPLTYNLSVESLEIKLKQARERGRIPKVVIPVHFAGQSCDMRAIGRLSKEYGFSVIEDASHAIGGSYLGEPIGDCRHSDITVFSFHPVKIITTGEGGMAVTNDSEIAARMSRLRSHGITRDPSQMTGTPDGPWYYQQVELGFNYRMTDVQAALGLSQLKRTSQYVAQRHVIAARYDQSLKGLPLTIPWQFPDAYSALHLYVVRLHVNEIQTSRLSVFEAMRAAGIGVNVHYIPVHLQPYYANLGFSRGYCPKAERYYAEALTLPIYPMLTEAEQSYVVHTLRSAVKAV